MVDSQDVFIQQYQTAFESGLTLKQFADFLQIKPQSVTRRRYKIRQEVGLELPTLPSGDGNSDVQMPDTWKQVYSASHHKIDHSTNGARTLVITSAQNATKVFRPFLKSIKRFCARNDAELMVIPYRYKNPTSLWNANNKEDDWWDLALVPYLVTDYIQLTSSLQLFGPVKTQPTAKNPLSGYDSVSGMDSAIFGHPKIQLNTIPTPSKNLPKILTTTGAITVENYTESKTGFQGNFHHSLAALVVEIEHDGTFHIRHIQAEEETGSFYDLDVKYTPTSIQENQSIAGLVTGDTHAEFIDPKVRSATYEGPNSIVGVLKPPQIVFHDVEDFYRRNHHHRGDPFSAYNKQKNNMDSVEQGLQVTADFLDTIPAGIKRIIVKSNHDEAFDRWLKETEIKHDPINSRFYHYMMYNVLKSVEQTSTGYSKCDPFEFWCKNPDECEGLRNVADTLFLKRDQSHTIAGIEVGFHGDKGPNGARGSARAFAKIGPKTVIGHSHSPCIHEGVYQVGLSARLNLEYVSGPSSWLQTHCVLYPNGKRTLIHVVDGKWRR